MVQSLRHQREQFRWQRKAIEDRYLRAIAQVNDSVQIKLAQNRENYQVKFLAAEQLQRV
jgi:hypothetical protein